MYNGRVAPCCQFGFSRPNFQLLAFFKLLWRFFVYGKGQMKLVFLLHMLYRSICHQVSNQADKLALMAIILLGRLFWRLFCYKPRLKK